MEDSLTRFADMFSAMGTEPRLRIMRLLLSAHPVGMNVGEVHAALGMAPSTLSHHLDKLKNESLVKVRREGTFLRYTANLESLQDLLNFLYAECCTRTQALNLPCLGVPEAPNVALQASRPAQAPSGGGCSTQAPGCCGDVLPFVQPG